jgi:hypothetical protein
MGEFSAKLAKCNGKYKPTKIKADSRRYPVFYPGQSSTADYVARYHQLNNGGLGFFAPLNEDPCTLYSGADTHETIHDEAPDCVESFDDLLMAA